MAEPAKKQPRGWYWVQDMHTAARPAFWDGGLYRDAPSAIEVLSWHWPSFRVLSMCSPPTEQEIKAWSGLRA